MSDSPSIPRNRRVNRRIIPRTRVQIECLKGTMGLGRNLARQLLDVSETGARLTVTAELKPGQEVELALQGSGHVRPVKRLANVIWCQPMQDRLWQAGLHFQKRFEYAELVRLM